MSSRTAWSRSLFAAPRRDAALLIVVLLAVVAALLATIIIGSIFVLAALASGTAGQAGIEAAVMNTAAADIAAMSHAGGSSFGAGVASTAAPASGWEWADASLDTSPIAHVMHEARALLDAIGERVVDAFRAR